MKASAKDIGTGRTATSKETRIGQFYSKMKSLIAMENDYIGRALLWLSNVCIYSISFSFGKRLQRGERKRVCFMTFMTIKKKFRKSWSRKSTAERVMIGIGGATIMIGGAVACVAFA